MWNVAHLERSYDDSVVQQLHMSSGEYHPTTLSPEAPYYTTRALGTSSHHNTTGYYPPALPVGGTTEALPGIHSQPRGLYRASSSHVYPTNEYSPTEGNPESSSNTSLLASRAGSYDNSFPQSVTPESGHGTQIDAYNYMYHGQGPTGTVTSPSALSPSSGHQQHHHHKKSNKNEVASSRQRKSSKTAYQGFSPESLGGTTGSNRSKLRSASRTSKNTHHNPPASVEERKSRETHNNVEKQYRNRLNAHFESLLNALPDRMQSGEGDEGGDSLDVGDRRVSKAEVLEMARRHIKTLERECAVLEGERDELRDNMEKLRWLFDRCEGGTGGPEGTAFLNQASMS